MVFSHPDYSLGFLSVPDLGMENHSVKTDLKNADDIQDGYAPKVSVIHYLVSSM